MMVSRSRGRDKQLNLTTNMILCLPSPRIAVATLDDGTAKAEVFGRVTLFLGGADDLLQYDHLFRVASPDEAAQMGKPTHTL